VNKLIAILVLASACTDIDAVSSDLIGQTFGQTYDCAMVVTIDHPEQQTTYSYRPCFANDDDARQFAQDWVSNTCTPQVESSRSSGDCSADCKATISICSL
jgi:hypothetical protein